MPMSRPTGSISQVSLDSLAVMGFASGPLSSSAMLAEYIRARMPKAIVSISTIMPRRKGTLRREPV